MERKKIIGIIGTSSASPSVLSLAKMLGERLIDNGYRIATGGLMGIMEAVSKGAHNSSRYKEGDVIGIIPGHLKSDANDFVDIVIPTRMGYARNLILVSTADAVVAIAGGSGTLSEISMAWQYNKPIIAIQLNPQERKLEDITKLTESNDFIQNVGWSSILAGMKLDDRREEKIYSAKSIEDTIKLLKIIFNNK
ncbi:MAG: TIGR00725 family protein [Promethearchaeota archaeon]